MSAESTTTASAVATAPPFVLARAVVHEVHRVSPSFLRVVLGGDGLADVGTPGATFDQRIKLVFPPDAGVLPDLAGAGGDWYQRWLAVPEAERGAMRTYSIRDVQVDAAGTRLVIDFVLHLEPGLTGPASSWASRAVVGDELLVVGPRRGRTDGGGIEYAPGAAWRILLAGDETAAPAIARIIEDAGDDLAGTAFIEVPEAADALAIDAPPGMTVTWLARTGLPHGTRLIPAVLDHLGGEPVDVAPPAARDGEPDELLWETPTYSGLGEALPDAPSHADRYAWIAGESRVVTTLRRHLVRDLGFERAQVAFMGYWRRGVAMKG